LAEGESSVFVKSLTKDFNRVSFEIEEHKVLMTVPYPLGHADFLDLVKSLKYNFVDHLIESYSNAVKETMQQELEFGDRPLTFIVRSEPEYISWFSSDVCDETLMLLSRYKIVGSVSKLRKLYFDICKTCPNFFVCVAQHKHPQLCKIVTELS
jgi:hypothetical protein